MNDKDGHEIDCFNLSGKVVYTDKDNFIVLANHGCSAEITGFKFIPMEECIINYPSFDFRPDSTFKNPGSYPYLIPLDQKTEAFLVDI